MKAMDIEDPLFGKVTVRADGPWRCTICISSKSKHHDESTANGIFNKEISRSVGEEAFLPMLEEVRLLQDKYAARIFHPTVLVGWRSFFPHHQWGAQD